MLKVDFLTISWQFRDTKSDIKWKKRIAQRGARTHDPEIKSLMLYRLS